MAQQKQGKQTELLQGTLDLLILKAVSLAPLHGNNRKAKYYKLTRPGRERLAGETAKWNRMTGIIGNILRTTPEEV